MNKKTFFVETFGCQMNKCDSELMDFSMEESGFVPSNDEESADIVIFNTCSVRKHAEDRAISRIRSVKKKKKPGRRLIVLAGCMAQRIGETLLKEKRVDIVIGPYQSPGIGKVIKSFLDGDADTKYLSREFSDFSDRINFQLAGKRSLHWHRWVTITHGCSNFCSYCIVPYVRGPLISFPPDMITEYIRILSVRGISEITLLGQNVNQYGQDRGYIPFYRLLDKIAGINNIERINFLTSHPMDFTVDIIRVIEDHPNISRAVHLPLQSGSNRMLEAMNRKYTIEHYMNLVERLNAILGTYSISTDLIVGFPGETEEDYSLTLRAVEAVRFDDAFMYAYSPREGTSAFELHEALTRGEKINRLNSLISLQRKISGEKLISRIDCTEEVIIERISKKSGREVMGRTLLNHPVVLPGSRGDIGKKIMIRIAGLKGSTLIGRRIIHDK